MAELGEHEQAGHEPARGEFGVGELVVIGDAALIDDCARSQPGWRGESVRMVDQGAAVAARWERLAPLTGVGEGSLYRTWEVADWLRESAAGPVGDEVVAR